MGITSFLDPIFNPFMNLIPSPYNLIIFSLALSVALTLSYKYITNQKLMKELKDEMATKPEENIIQGEVLEIDVKDSLIYATLKDKLVAAVGVKGLVIVDTRDALLVCAKDKTNEVKKVIEHLKSQNKNDYL